MEPEGQEPAESSLGWIQRLFVEEVPLSPLPEDRTGGLRFRKGVPEALLHQGRNNIGSLGRLSERIEREKHRAVITAGKPEGFGSRAALAALLYWNAPSIPIFLIAESLGFEPDRIRTLAEKNPTATIRCLDCDAPIHPESRWHFQEMLRSVETFNQNPDHLRDFLYTGLHCEDCTLEREDRWGEEWRRQEYEYQQRLLELRTMPYQEYLRTPEWRGRRERKLDQADHRCQFCNRHRRSLKRLV